MHNFKTDKLNTIPIRQNSFKNNQVRYFSSVISRYPPWHIPKLQQSHHREDTFVPCWYVTILCYMNWIICSVKAISLLLWHFLLERKQRLHEVSIYNTYNTHVYEYYMGSKCISIFHCAETALVLLSVVTE